MGVGRGGGVGVDNILNKMLFYFLAVKVSLRLTLGKGPEFKIQNYCLSIIEWCILGVK